MHCPIFWTCLRCGLKELATKVKAKFPSPTVDLGATRIDVLEKLILRSAATCVTLTSGESMVECGIFDSDILLVDRAIRPRHGYIANVKRASGMKQERRRPAYVTPMSTFPVLAHRRYRGKKAHRYDR